MAVVWAWAMMALIGTVATWVLLHWTRREARRESIRRQGHPVRKVADRRVRNQWLCLPAFAVGLVLGVLVLVRDNLPFEIPPGISVAEILLLMGTLMALQVLDVWDDFWGRWRQRRDKEAQHGGS